jgi:hypothetical protein
MNLHRTAAFLAAACSLALAAACSDPPLPPNPPPAPTSSASSLPVPACRLPAPLKSEDACTTDADCGVSEPCHAHACVAKAKSRPRTPDTMCTMVMDCQSADVNRCGCFEGRCALIPPP